MQTTGVGAWHDVDRAFKELLEEMRIAQMGGQITLGFLLAIAYTPVIRAAGVTDRELYAWAVAVTTSSVVLLLAPVPLHRLNFGQRSRRQILVVGHALALAGLLALAGGLVLSVWLAARIALLGAASTIVLVAVALLVLTWLVLPLGLRARDRRAATGAAPRPDAEGTRSPASSAR